MQNVLVEIGMAVGTDTMAKDTDMADMDAECTGGNWNGRWYGYYGQGYGYGGYGYGYGGYGSGGYGGYYWGHPYG